MSKISEDKIKYKEIIDICHNLDMTDDDINNLDDDACNWLIAFGTFVEAAKLIFNSNYEEEKAKKERRFANYLANHTREQNIEMMVEAFHEYYDKK